MHTYTLNSFSAEDIQPVRQFGHDGFCVAEVHPFRPMAKVTEFFNDTDTGYKMKDDAGLFPMRLVLVDSYEPYKEQFPFCLYLYFSNPKLSHEHHDLIREGIEWAGNDKRVSVMSPYSYPVRFRDLKEALISKIIFDSAMLKAKEPHVRA